MQEPKNAVIRKVFLGYDDCGVFTYRLELDYGGFGQAAGMISLGDVYTHRVVKGLIDTVGVKSWEELPGKYVRVIAEPTCVLVIGNIIENKWFNIDNSYMVDSDDLHDACVERVKASLQGIIATQNRAKTEDREATFKKFQAVVGCKDV